MYGRGPEQAGEGDRPAGVQQHAAGQGGASAALVPADESELAKGFRGLEPLNPLKPLKP